MSSGSGDRRRTTGLNLALRGAESCRRAEDLSSEPRRGAASSTGFGLLPPPTERHGRHDLALAAAGTGWLSAAEAALLWELRRR